ncbi:recombinase family protein [Paenibacillus sp. FSL K6-2524]|uniref:recombinase family protein n=1 Tax=Paenibacillus sp. FSL K6-2524 TaxID=2954516 RepID=UPI0030F93515
MKRDFWGSGSFEAGIRSGIGQRPKSGTAACQVSGAGCRRHTDALDRLGRAYDGIISEWKHITREINADIVCLENEALFDSRKFKTMGDIGKLLEDQFLSMLAYVAEQERKKNRQRQAEGIEVARASGVTFGRPRQQVDEKFLRAYEEWRAGRMTATAAMKQSGLTKPTFYRRVKEYEAREKQ